MRVLSLGGGTQSCALALMSAAGELPKLDGIIFADTHGELPETYAYLDYLRPILAAADIPFQVVSAGSLEQALLADAPTSSNPTPPAHVLNPDGSKGRINRYRCSYDYKRRLIERATKRLVGGRGAWKRPGIVEQWIGFSADEVGRCKPARECSCGHSAQRHESRSCDRCACQRFEPWQVNRWPLIELDMRRDDTIRWFADHGHPTPPRSACWFCPNSSDARWRALRADHPDLFERAVHLDATIRNGGSFNARGNQRFAGTIFLHAQRVPLDEVDLRTSAERAAADGQDALFDVDALGLDCEAGVCFT